MVRSREPDRKQSLTGDIIRLTTLHIIVARAETTWYAIPIMGLKKKIELTFWYVRENISGTCYHAERGSEWYLQFQNCRKCLPVQKFFICYITVHFIRRVDNCVWSVGILEQVTPILLAIESPLWPRNPKNKA